MSCEVAALPFQAHANYRIWSIDFDLDSSFLFHFDTINGKVALEKIT